MSDYFFGFKENEPHPCLVPYRRHWRPATGTEGRCELCGLDWDAPLHEQYRAAQEPSEGNDA